MAASRSCPQRSLTCFSVCQRQNLLTFGSKIRVIIMETFNAGFDLLNGAVITQFHQQKILITNVIKTSMKSLRKIQLFKFSFYKELLLFKFPFYKEHVFMYQISAIIISIILEPTKLYIHPFYVALKWIRKIKNFLIFLDMICPEYEFCVRRESWSRTKDD